MDYLLGRDDACHIRLEGEAISRRHAAIERDGVNYVVRDLGSTNGTFLNENRIECAALKSGDRLRLGKQIFKFVANGELEGHYHEVMFQYAVCDGLTQLHNKRFFLELLVREINQCGARQACVAVLLLDLDKFKAINDTYGHLAGDAVLVEFARRAAEVLRNNELLARFGGEEFAVLCPGASIEEARAVAETIRQAIAHHPFEYEGFPISVTISIGVAITHSSSETPQALLERADQCLYHAKASGRNQTKVSPETSEPISTT
jgi:diguanylate cyclase (GGDEF)-like protein